MDRKPMIKPASPSSSPPPYLLHQKLLCFVCFPLSSSPSLPLAPPRCTQAFLSGATAAYPSQSCGAILGAFYPNTVPRLIEPRTEDMREVRRGGRLNHHQGVDWSPSASCALHIPPVVAVGIPLFGVVSF